MIEIGGIKYNVKVLLGAKSSSCLKHCDAYKECSEDPEGLNCNSLHHYECLDCNNRCTDCFHNEYRWVLKRVKSTEPKPEIKKENKMNLEDCETRIHQVKEVRECHPLIAEAIKAGRDILCEVTSSAVWMDKPVWICGHSYVQSSAGGYYGENLLSYYDARPVPKSKRTMLESNAMVLALLDYGYLPQPEGHWLDCDGAKYLPDIFKYCGKPASEAPEMYQLDWLTETL